MNWFNILDALEKADPEAIDRLSTRRRVMSGFAGMAQKVTLAALPMAIGSMFEKAYGKGSETVNQVLQYALYLEHLENEFYKAFLASSTAFTGAGGGPVPPDEAKSRGAIQVIQTHEQQHVRFLEGVLGLSADQGKPNIDLDGGKGNSVGPFSIVLDNYSNALLAAQLFEDTGVRAYKGRAGELLGQKVPLTAALQIHSVEARHASHIRQMRKAIGVDVKPWVTQTNGGVPAGIPGISAAGAAIYGADSMYPAESNTTQAGVNIIVAGVTADQASESFDEALTPAAVLSVHPRCWPWCSNCRFLLLVEKEGSGGGARISPFTF